MASPKDNLLQVPENAIHEVSGFVKNSNSFIDNYLVPLAWKAGGALILWLIGGLVIKLLARLMREGMVRNHVDATLINYVESAMKIALRVLLVLAILSIFGVETTSFAAFIAAAGIAIGAAWAGLLSNLAAGIFIIVLRPYRVGDYITAGGVSGIVREISIFTTTMQTFDMVQVFVGNTKIFSDNIQNFSLNNIRRVDHTVQMHISISLEQATALFKDEIEKHPEVLKDPPVDFGIGSFNDSGYVLTIRPFCRSEAYWRVQTATNNAILKVLQQNSLPAAAPTQYVIQQRV